MVRRRGLCAGAAIALAWYAYQEGFHRALRVAVFAGLGGAIGFASGNFFQTLGSLSGVSYNWWNVMEFTLGFCGGLGMGYAVATTAWPAPAAPSRIANWIALLFVTFLLPLSNYVNGFTSDKLAKLADRLSVEDPASFVSLQQTLALGILVAVAIGAAINWARHEKAEDSSLRRLGSFVLFAYTFYYVVYGLLVRGFFYRNLSIAQSDTTYLPILLLAAAIWLISGRGKAPSQSASNHGQLGTDAIALASLGVAAIVAFAAATVALHDGKIHFHERFPTREAARPPAGRARDDHSPSDLSAGSIASAQRR